MVEQLTRHHSRRLQVLPHDSPPAMEGQEGVTMERPASADACIKNTSIARPREEFSIYNNPLV